jgi:hypothetical protein
MAGKYLIPKSEVDDYISRLNSMSNGSSYMNVMEMYIVYKQVAESIKLYAFSGGNNYEIYEDSVKRHFAYAYDPSDGTRDDRTFLRNTRHAIDRFFQQFKKYEI